MELKPILKKAPQGTKANTKKKSMCSDWKTDTLLLHRLGARDEETGIKFSMY
jgi:hypothetical protein